MYPATKFHPPTVGPRSVVRTDLLATLTGRRPTAVVAQAPAGYGKTTMIVQWLTGAAARTLWVSLDSDDDDPAGLWGAIGAAARAAGLGDEPAFRPSGTGNVRTDTMVPLLDGFASSDDRWVLVLDDVHLLRREEPVASLDWFLARVPENLTVVIITRSTLDLPALHQLRIRGEVVELTPTTLALSIPETTELLRTRFGLTLSAAEVERIGELTGGWPAAVSLVGSALAHGLPLGRILVRRPDDDAGLRALVHEGLAGSAPADFDLLRQMSVFERFDAELLAAVLRTDEAWGVAMDVADRTGLIVTLDDEGRWWRLHHLVRDGLHSELGRVNPVLRRELHRRAAEILERENDLPALVHHLLGAQDYDTLADILANVRASAVVPRQAQGLGWLDRIPAAALDRDPRLAFWEAWATATSGDRQRRDRALARGRLAAGARSVDGFRSWDDVEDFIHSMACFDAVSAARRAGERFLDRYPDGPLRPLVASRRASMLYLEGRCHEALEVLDVLEQGPPVARPLRLLMPAYAALCHLELGDPSAARAQVERCQAARSAYRLGADLTYLPAEQALARIRTEHGQPDIGLATALHALEVAQSFGGDPALLVPHLLLEVARAQHALGNPDEARVALNQAEDLCVGSVDAGALPARIADLRHQFGLRLTLSTAHVGLSRRELDVLALLPTPLSASQIAAELFVSPNTVRSHVKSIHRKLGVSSRGEAVAAARGAGLIVGLADPVR